MMSTKRTLADMVPPESMRFVGPGDFLAVGQEFLQHFIVLGRLRPDDTVLDVGCGIGRMALPLTQYLSSAARYEGFDIVPSGIAWCTERITSLYSNFHFQLADIYNSQYNAKGTYRASEYRFPFPNEAFDFVFLTSVFTHMLPEDMEHYCHEIFRVMKSTGRCLMTAFLVDADVEARLSQGKARFSLDHVCGPYRVARADIPEAVVGYNEGFVLGLLERAGLILGEPVQHGVWSGRRRGRSYQDIIVAVKMLREPSQEHD